jgi:hypothetical protein
MAHSSVVQQARVAHDPWEDEIECKLAGLSEDKVKDGAYCVGVTERGEREWRVASSYLLSWNVLNIPVDRQTSPVTKRLVEVMRTLGWTKPAQTIRVGTKPCRGFTKPIVEPIVGPAAVEQNAVVEVQPVVNAVVNANAVVELKPKPKTPRLWLRPL